MKNMKRVFQYLGCVSTKTVEAPCNNNGSDIHTLEIALKTVQSPVWEPPGSKEEAFFDSQPWLESDDEQDFFSVNGDIPPYKAANKDGDHQGRRLAELFKESSSFSSDSPTSLKAAACCEEQEGKAKHDQIPTIGKNNNGKIEGTKSGKSVKHCLPSLVRSLSCGDRTKKRPSPARMPVVAA